MNLTQEIITEGGLMHSTSVIVRVKNEEQWIPHCLEAILGQTDVKTEIVVLDNNSTDRTIEIVKKFPVKIYTYDKEYLPGKCLNYGISKCLG